MNTQFRFDKPATLEFFDPNLRSGTPGSIAPTHVVKHGHAELMTPQSD